MLHPLEDTPRDATLLYFSTLFLSFTQSSESTDRWVSRRKPSRLGDCLGWDRCWSCAESLGSSRCSRRASTCTNREGRVVCESEAQRNARSNTITHHVACFWHNILLYFICNQHQSWKVEATSVPWLLTSVLDSKQVSYTPQLHRGVHPSYMINQQAAGL